MHPQDLYQLEPDLPDLGTPVLIEALDGFIDAGSAKRLAREHLLAGESRVIARFDADLLHDYRARRPAMLFVDDHWESYDHPELVLRQVADAAGTPYLVLDGPEPDVQWERFTSAVRQLVERLGVRLTIGLGAIPMAVPHTRPLGIIVHGTRKELVTGRESWISTVQVPGSAGHLLEYRLGQAGRDAMGFAVHVPHYLTQTEYPAAAVLLVESVAKAAGLTIPTTSLLDAAQTAGASIDAQVAQSPEVAEIVTALENQYDLFISRRGQDLLAGASSIPTADELGAELERFLADQARHGDGAE